MAVTTANNHAAVVKSDSTVFAEVSAIYIGGAGDIALVLSGSSTVVTYVGVVAGSYLPVNAVKVMSANTTATDIVRVFN